MSLEQGRDNALANSTTPAKHPHGPARRTPPPQKHARLLFTLTASATSMSPTGGGRAIHAHTARRISSAWVYPLRGHGGPQANGMCAGVGGGYSHGLADDLVTNDLCQGPCAK